MKKTIVIIIDSRFVLRNLVLIWNALPFLAEVYRITGCPRKIPYKKENGQRDQILNQRQQNWVAEQVQGGGCFGILQKEDPAAHFDF